MPPTDHQVPAAPANHNQPATFLQWMAGFLIFSTTCLCATAVYLYSQRTELTISWMEYTLAPYKLSINTISDITVQSVNGQQISIHSKAFIAELTDEENKTHHELDATDLSLTIPWFTIFGAQNRSTIDIASLQISSQTLASGDLEAGSGLEKTILLESKQADAPQLKLTSLLHHHPSTLHERLPVNNLSIEKFTIIQNDLQHETGEAALSGKLQSTEQTFSLTLSQTNSATNNKDIYKNRYSIDVKLPNKITVKHQSTNPIDQLGQFEITLTHQPDGSIKISTTGKQTANQLSKQILAHASALPWLHPFITQLQTAEAPISWNLSGSIPSLETQPNSFWQDQSLSLTSEISLSEPIIINPTKESKSNQKIKFKGTLTAQINPGQWLVSAKQNTTVWIYKDDSKNGLIMPINDNWKLSINDKDNWQLSVEESDIIQYQSLEFKLHSSHWSEQKNRVGAIQMTIFGPLPTLRLNAEITTQSQPNSTEQLILLTGDGQFNNQVGNIAFQLSGEKLPAQNRLNVNLSLSGNSLLDFQRGLRQKQRAWEPWLREVLPKSEHWLKRLAHRMTLSGPFRSDNRFVITFKQPHPTFTVRQQNITPR